ncbi:MAG: CPBP family intramembrane metalloprotease [Oscillatoriales cyanobacterium]|nr:MAG: CPBP family intramembrane metalloprotease [Oscillatoriales cyanobacterium]TAF65508.1 MAG: CPBP family intramembrane metalloprotease [Oscillatoriales cyanobacterium]
MLEHSDRQNAQLALILLVPASSIGVASLFIAPGTIGTIVSVLCGFWLLVLPIAWSVLGDRYQPHLSKPKYQELLVGTVLGLLMFGIILGIYGLFGQHWIDAADAKSKVQQMGLNNPIIFLIVQAYFVLINSFIEEFIWRWFVYKKCEILIPGKAGIFLSALFFTLHHIIVLAAYTDWHGVILGSLAVFVAGAIWSWCYLAYRSLWASYISHAIADFALSIIAWKTLYKT